LCRNVLGTIRAYRCRRGQGEAWVEARMSAQQGPVGSVPARRRGLPVPPRRALAVLGGLVLALVIAAPVLGVLARPWSASDAGPVAEVAALCIVGAVIAWHRPANPLGWILLGAGGSNVLSAVCGSYSVLDYRIHHGALPFGPVAVLLQPAWAVTFTLLGLVILLYPDGRLPSSRWRFMLWPYLALAALYLGGALVIAAGALAHHQVWRRPWNPPTSQCG
jgi:hypothetical protein